MVNIIHLAFLIGDFPGDVFLKFERNMEECVCAGLRKLGDIWGMCLIPFSMKIFKYFGIFTMSKSKHQLAYSRKNNEEINMFLHILKCNYLSKILALIGEPSNVVKSGIRGSVCRYKIITCHKFKNF